MKKLLALILATLMIVSMCACSADNGDDFTKFTRKIEIVCPWGAGGGADTTVRQFATLLEKELGVSVVVNNVTGAGGISGVEYATKQPADGYTWLVCTPSPMLAQISGATEFDVVGSITPVCNMVWDCNMFVAGKDAPYNNFDELMAYVTANPGSVKCGVMALTGLDGACVSAAFNGAIEAVAYSEGSQLNSDLIGNHIGLACVGPAEIASMVQSGDLKPIMTCTEKPVHYEGFPEVGCAADAGLECFFGPYRGIFCKNGTPEAAIKLMEEAANKVVNGTEFQEWAKAQGLDQRTGWMDSTTYKAQWESDFADLTAMFGK